MIAITLATAIGLAFPLPSLPSAASGTGVSYAASSVSPGQQCFVEVPSGSIVVNQTATSAVVIWSNGTKHTYSLSAGSCSAVMGEAPTINGWVESTQHTLGSGYYSGLLDYWNVPTAPSGDNGNWGGQLIYAFDGVQDSDYIFQPVLGWGCEAYSPILGICVLGGGHWWISAEVCNSSCAFTSAITVSAGDQISGNVIFLNGDRNHCPNTNGNYYSVIVKDVTTGSSAVVTTCSNGGALGVSGALEMYRISSCSQLPQSPYDLDFNNIASTPSVSSWTGQTNSVSPSCSFSAIGGSNYGLLYWYP